MLSHKLMVPSTLTRNTLAELASEAMTPTTAAQWITASGCSSLKMRHRLAMSVTSP